MTILALDTTTRPGSAALLRHDEVLEIVVGDATRTHGERLPGELVALLARHGLTARDVALYAVAAGPGSFTGLRVGIACIQGLALANDRLVVAVSALEALALAAAGRDMAGDRTTSPASDDVIAVWMDAQRGQVFSGIFAGAGSAEAVRPLVDARVDDPLGTLRGWQRDGDALPRVRRFAGDGAMRYAELIRDQLGARIRVETPPPIAGAIASLARARADRAIHPAAIQPIYIRRADAELARDRPAPRAAGAPGRGTS